jgi:exonuclease SbcC
VRLNALQLTNFRQHAESRLEFDTGLTGIIGPNGAGKSTILEAIAWALYGQPAARGTKDSIRFVRAGPRASVRVELDFDLAGHRYRVVRGLTSAELYLDGGSQPIANSLTSVSDLLQRRLGMTRTEFFHTYFTGQKELNVMAALGPADRARFLNRVLGYEKLRVAQDLVRDRKALIAAELNGLRAAMPDAEAVQRALQESAQRRDDAALAVARARTRHEHAAARLSELAPDWREAQAARERHLELAGEVRVVESELTGQRRDLERLQRELDAIDSARAELTRITAEIAPLAGIAVEFGRLEELLREEGRRKTLSEAARALADELVQKRERMERIARAPQLEEEATVALEAKRREVEEALGRIEGLRTDWVRDRQEAETKRDALRKQYAELKDQRESVMQLGEDGVCPTCTRVLGESFRSVLDQLDEQLETITVDGRYYNTRLEQLEQIPPDIQRLEEHRRELQREVGELERNLARIQSAVQERAQLSREITGKEQRHEQLTKELESIPLGYDAARHEELRRETDRLAPLNDQATRLSTQLERESTLRTDRARTETEVQRLDARLAELVAARDAIRYSEQDYASLRDAQEAAAAESRDAEIAMAAANGELQNAERAVDSATRASQDLQRTQDKLDAMQRDKRLHDELDRAFTDLRTDLNHALRPELSELASAFLAELTDHRYSELELDDQYNIVVLEDGHPKPVISGGEEDLANLVLRLAISQMIAERAGQSFSLLVLDEIFGSLDEVRRHNVVELLKRLQDRFEQVILITHIESVREGLDHVITIGYDEEAGSSVVQAVPPSYPALELVGGALEGAGADA